MFESWTREVERITFSTIEQAHRIVGLTATSRGSGVSLLANQLANLVSRSGKPVLLVNFSGSLDPGLERLPWQPGQDGAINCVRPNAHGIDQLDAQFNASSRFLFNWTSPGKVEGFSDRIGESGEHSWARRGQRRGV